MSWLKRWCHCSAKNCIMLLHLAYVSCFLHLCQKPLLMSTWVIKMTTSHKTIQNAMTKKEGKAAKFKERSRCQNDEMKDRMRIRWSRDWGQTYPYPTIFRTFLDESKLPHFQKNRGIFTPPYTPMAPPLLLWCFWSLPCYTLEKDPVLFGPSFQKVIVKLIVIFE